MIDDYQNRLADTQKKLLVRHCNKYNITPVICAWYEDAMDFIEEWSQYGYTKTEARYKLNMKENQGEFKIFPNGKIIRLVV
jgi:hypothetical protein